MIIWGSTGKTKPVGKGTFFCPRCRTESGYSRMKVARYFTLYFIPLFETQALGEYIHCERCKKDFDLEVLELAVLSGVPPPLPPASFPNGAIPDVPLTEDERREYRAAYAGWTTDQLHHKLAHSQGLRREAIRLIQDELDLRKYGPTS